METSDKPAVEESDSIFSVFLRACKKVQSFIGTKLLFALVIGGVAAGSVVFLNILANANPSGKLASLRASAGFPSFGSQVQEQQSFQQATGQCPVVSPNTLTNGWVGCYYWYSPRAILSATGETDYFNSENFVFSRNDSAIAFDWDGFRGVPFSPSERLPSDYFSVRWSGTFNFNAAEYFFVAGADDGMRIYIDGTRVLDSWFPETRTNYKFTQKLSAGSHTIVVEYFEATGIGAVHVSWSTAPY